ncbi:1,4-dihydroxy-2-naphthoate polyprenyltransferase [Bacillus carboniphilus]|uniref:1,4-dihydroxy-2-naphthoate octaprenyltransferase n=1 Tax=Bacillus carboniphilus TaxID=86663 RepID=A0ABY9JPG4_9BACI|nr:1,4-dihydroxy-2-naphthoate polyprenyltransferase [Bacillus carboniphilus]WLR41202.1 1,4-dihydroxy-2-naphthoate polyprenyltransferase [Bacillus carboniphilus]
MGNYASASSLPPFKHDKNFKIWFQLLRPHTLTAGFIPVFVGTVLALLDGFFRLDLFIAMLIASLFIQSATNMFNEYYDFKRGLDHENSVGIGGAIVRHGVKPETVLRLAFVFYGISLLLGLYICFHSSWWIALVGFICMCAGYFYTGGPYPIAYTPFGEITAGLFMGVIIVSISFFIQTGFISLQVILMSLPLSLLIATILMANNIRDLDGDKQNGRKTLAIMLGRKNAIICLSIIFGLSYLLPTLFIIFGYGSLWLLLVAFSIPHAIKAIKGFIGKIKPIEMMPAMKATAQTNTIFGLFLSIGLLIHYFIENYS